EGLNKSARSFVWSPSIRVEQVLRGRPQPPACMKNSKMGLQSVTSPENAKTIYNLHSVHQTSLGLPCLSPGCRRGSNAADINSNALSRLSAVGQSSGKILYGRMKTRETNGGEIVWQVFLDFAPVLRLYGCVAVPCTNERKGRVRCEGRPKKLPVLVRSSRV